MLKRSLSLAIAAGIFISIGGAVFLSCENSVVGAVFFSVALLSICFMGLYLFTGKVGFLAVSHTGREIAEVVLTLLGNLIGTFLGGILVSEAKPKLMENAIARCLPRLEMGVLPILITAFFCGILMYTAVAIYKEKGSPLGIFFCVPVFILSGFEHSIADMFYFFCARMFSGEVFLFLLLVVIGNAVGGMFIPALRRLAEEKNV
ncbi:MAG: formate/nitrite transporter family protein [Oscillospiraceae bacterium]|nr:formate/nitrite transporter family protein [Oscillospiraceae bacterium]